MGRATVGTMSTAVTRRVKRLLFVSWLLPAVLAGLLVPAGGAAAGNGFEQLVGPYNDGCYYYWDGYAYTQRVCPRADAGVDIYNGVGGQWVFVYSGGYTADGGVWIMLANGQIYYSVPTTIVGGGNGGFDYTWTDAYGNPVDASVVNPSIVGGGVTPHSDNSNPYFVCLWSISETDWDLDGYIGTSEDFEECRSRQ